jgi:4-amino-4-deoxy-L-arabinose transferase-like glycosyltransferase
MRPTSLIETGFSDTQLLWIFLAFALGITSMILFLKGNTRVSVLFLFLSGLVLRLVVSTLDPFLNTWDEQFHALVAKNLVSHPLKPMLISNPVLPYDYTIWINNHIWLHKQPWYLWQIALFFKLFGTSEFVLRLPTTLMFSLLIPVIFRIGKLVANETTGWYGAFLYTYSLFFVNFVSGASFTDHNDGAFIFYVGLSLWSFLEYQQSKQRRWVWWIGIFAGIAILNKWLVGLLVYSGWIAAMIAGRKDHPVKEEIRNLLTALSVTILIALPWQIFISFAYPLESHYEFMMNSNHFFKAVEGHSGYPMFYESMLSIHYGKLAPFLILPGLYLLFRKTGDNRPRFAWMTWIIIPYVFFSWAATKMPMFCDIILPFIFLALGAIMEETVNVVRKHIPRKAAIPVVTVLFSLLAYENLYIDSIDRMHSKKAALWKKSTNLAILDKYIAGKLDHESCVIFNSGGLNATMLMFYSGKTAYATYPRYEDYLDLCRRNIRIAVIADKSVPGYLSSDPNVIKIRLGPIDN